MRQVLYTCCKLTPFRVSNINTVQVIHQSVTSTYNFKLTFCVGRATYCSGMDLFKTKEAPHHPTSGFCPLLVQLNLCMYKHVYIYIYI